MDTLRLKHCATAIAQQVGIKLVFLLGTTSGAAVAHMPVPTQYSSHTGEFQRIEQPLGLKVGITLGGLAIIGLELWWFLSSKTPNRATKSLEALPIRHRANFGKKDAF